MVRSLMVGAAKVRVERTFDEVSKRNLNLNLKRG